MSVGSVHSHGPSVSTLHGHCVFSEESKFLHEEVDD